MVTQLINEKYTAKKQARFSKTVLGYAVDMQDAKSRRIKDKNGRRCPTKAMDNRDVINPVISPATTSHLHRVIDFQLKNQDFNILVNLRGQKHLI